MPQTYLVRIRSIIALLCFVVLTGCATTLKVTPAIPEKSCSAFQMEGSIQYDKNPLYLPRTVKLADNPNGEDVLVVNYQYQVSYGRDFLYKSAEFIPLFNPLTLIGAPIGADNVYVMGKLDVSQKDQNLKSYQSVCTLEKFRNLFHQGETFSEMRKKGLISVRDNIEVQMCRDKAFLTNLTDQINP